MYIGGFAAATAPPDKRHKKKHVGEELGSLDTLPVVLSEYDDFVDPILRTALDSLESNDLIYEGFRPNLGPNITWEVTPEGVLWINEIVVNDARKVVFSIKNNTENFLVYEHDCVVGGGINPIHPLLSRAAYVYAAAPMSAESRILFVSPPTTFVNSFKTPFVMSSEDFAKCVRAGGNVRYAVIERFQSGRSFPLATFAPRMRSQTDGVRAYSQLFRVGGLLLESIEHLHKRSIVHGNLRPSAVVLYWDGLTKMVPRFYDFGKAGWAHPSTGMMIHKRKGITMTQDELIWRSPAEIRDGESHLYSKMDDVFRAVEIIAFYVNDASVPDPRIMMHQEGTLGDFKIAGQLFGDFVKRFTPIVPSLPSVIGRIETLARFEKPFPPYGEIASLFRNVSKAFDSYENAYRIFSSEYTSS